MTERRPDYNILDISSQPATNGMETYNLVMYWARGKGGTCLVGNTWANFVNGQSGSGQTVTVWPSDNGYIASLPGTQTTTVYTNGVFEMSFTDTNIPPPTVEWMEKSESDGSLPDDFNANWGELSSRVVKLFTGGRAERQVQKLFDLHEELTKEQYLDMNVPDWGFWYQTGNFLSTGNPAVAVPSAQIALGALGNQADDGHLWTVQPNGKEIVITPTVAAGSAEGSTSAFQANASPPASSTGTKLNPTGSLPNAPQYQLVIKANNITLSNNAVATGANFCVGQNVSFNLTGLPDGVTATNFQWTLGGTYVNKCIPAPDANSSDTYTNDPLLLKNAVLQTNWWVSGGYPSNVYSAVVTFDLIFTNGNPKQSGSVSGLFSMHRPRVTYFDVGNIGEYLYHKHPTGVQPSDDVDMLSVVFCNYSCNIGIIDPFSGAVYITQTFSGSSGSDGDGKYDTATANVLDNDKIYGFSVPKQIAVSAGITNTIFFQDGAQTPCSGHTWENDHYTDYIVFVPSGANAIPVTLGIVKWHQNGDTSLSPIISGSASPQDYTPFPTSGGLQQPDGTYVNKTGDAKFDSMTTDNAFPSWSGTYINGETN